MALTDKTSGQLSDTKIRCKLQEIFEDNKRAPIGRFHQKEISESGVINDILKQFDLTPKKP